MGWGIEHGTHIGRWTAERLDTGYFAERSQAIGLIRDGVIVAGIIYENFNGKSLMAHIVIEGKINKTYLHAIYDYAFNVCGVDKAIVPVQSSNLKSMRLVENMGFSEEARIKDSCPTGDILLYTMKKTDCRFLETRYGQKHTETARAA